MHGRIVAQGGSFFDPGALLGPTRTCSSASYMIGTMMIACAFCVPAARQWAQTRRYCWARRSLKSIPRAAEPLAISSTCR